jgi:LPXTG-motif cell wall-anchored protein
MTLLSRAAAAAVATALAVAAPLLLASSATAAPADVRVVMFSNELHSDVEDEDAETLDALERSGATVTVFDGGDGSLEAWTTILADADAFVLPESEGVYGTTGTDVLSVEAAAYLKAWIAEGHRLLVAGAYTQEELFSYLVGVDYSDVWDDDAPDAPWMLQVDSVELPETLSSANYSGGQYRFDEYTDEQRAPITPIYLTEDGSSLGVGRFAVGGGAAYYLAYDWYPGDKVEVEEFADDPEWVEAWDMVLQTLVLELEVVEPEAPAPTTPDAETPVTTPVAAAPVAPLPAAAPELAATGASHETLLAAVLGGGLLLSGAALLVLRRPARGRHSS